MTKASITKNGYKLPPVGYSKLVWQTGFDSNEQSLTASECGQWVLNRVPSYDSKYTYLLWAAASGVIIREFENMYYGDFVSDGSAAVFLSDNNRIVVFDLTKVDRDHESISIIEIGLPDDVYQAIVSPHTNSILVYKSRGNFGKRCPLKLFNIFGGDESRNLPMSFDVGEQERLSPQFIQDTNWLVCLTSCNGIDKFTVFDVDTGEKLSQFWQERLENRNYAESGYWDKETGSLRSQGKVKYFFSDSFVLSPDGSLGASTSCDGRVVTIWNTANGKSVHTSPKSFVDLEVRGFSKDGKSIFVLAEIKLFSVPVTNLRAMRIWSYEGQPILLPGKHSASAISVGLQTSGFCESLNGLIAVSGSMYVSTWDADLRACLAHIPLDISWHSSNNHMAFLSGEDRIAVSSYRGVSEIRDAVSGSCIVTMGRDIHSEKVVSSPDGTRFAIFEGQKEGQKIVWIWSFVDEELAPPVKLKTGPTVTCGIFSNDSRSFIAGNTAGEVVEWNLESGTKSEWGRKAGWPIVWLQWENNGDGLLVGTKEHIFRATKSPYDLSLVTIYSSSYLRPIQAISPDGELVVVDMYQILYGSNHIGNMVLDISVDAELLKIKDSDKKFFSFSAGSEQLITTCSQGYPSYNIRYDFWNISSGEISHSIDAENGRVACLSPDGDKIAVGMQDGRIIIYDQNSDGKLDVLLSGGHRSSIIDIAFLGDGKHLVSISRDRTTCIWELENYNHIFQCAAFGGDWVIVREDGSYCCQGDPLIGFAKGTEICWPE